MLKVNDIVVTPTIFPDGTSQVWKLPDGAFNSATDPTVTWMFESEAELFHLMQLDRLLGKYFNLWLPYLPYGRQDKAVSNETTFALRVFADALESINYLCNVRSFDPHSGVAVDEIAGFIEVSAAPLISELAKDFDAVCFPDSGAAKRYSLPGIKTFCGKKVRDQLTGKILRYELEGADGIAGGSRVLVVDDICDGGATFILLGNMLQCYKFRASLYVSHGIFSKGIEILKAYYEQIITTDTRPVKHKELTVYESAPPHRLLQG